ncbi:lectin subunit alpha-like [Haematobia irritans]|uniref:lectin subunit alpha-like n=1 Tax=Haematobia irritans TaxID=7368 RepID=UPI003F4FA03D
MKIWRYLLKLPTILLVTVILTVSQAVSFDKCEQPNEGNLEYGTIFIEQEQKYNWFEAWNECALRNMTLIAVDTAEKHVIINSMLRKKFPKVPNLWIGGNDLGEEGKFVWSSTGKPFTFSNWQKGQPDNYKSIENCVHFYDITDFEWNDVQCVFKMGFICEENRFQVSARQNLKMKKRLIDQLFET